MISELDKSLASPEFLPYVYHLINSKIRMNKDSKKINITINHLKSGYTTDISCVMVELRNMYSDYKINYRRDTGQGYDFTIIDMSSS